jgi:5-methylcytosine-specific restriction protein A
MPSSAALNILSILVDALARTVPGRPQSYLGYKEVHDLLQLRLIGKTYGESLKRQGLEDLAIWTMKEALPAITGLVIDKTSLQPGDGYFRVFGKTEDFAWWEEEIRKAKEFDWSIELANDSTDDAREDAGAPKPANTKKNNFDAADYLTAFENLLPTASPNHIVMLRAHFEAENRTITATELARVAGYENFNAANLQYGIFAQKLCDELHFIPPTGNSGAATPTYVLAIPYKGGKLSDWTWTMHAPVVAALSKYWMTGEDSVEPIYADDVGQTENFLEGAVVQVWVNRYERNESARTACLDYWGTTCCVCDMDFAEIYGVDKSRGVHVHHLVPISQMAAEYKIEPIQDLRPVCPNCHAALHSENPPVAPEAMRKRIRARRAPRPVEP